MASSPYTVRWGIMATGGIAETFCKDLLTDPATRDVRDVRHEIAAVSSSTSADRAAAFIKKINASARPYGSYAELVSDADVDIVYVATPHSHHFQNAMLALEAGKNVLCEKALTVTAAQAKVLVAKAKEKGVFFMEAVWTRFFPLSIKIREMISAGEIGTVYRTTADLSFNENSHDGKGITYPDSHRMVNPDLAGGALLDLGVYALTWVFQTLYHVQPPSSQGKEAPRVLAAMNKYHTGADDNTSIICHFPQNNSIGVATSSLRVATLPKVGGTATTASAAAAAAAPAIRIQGSKGEIQVFHPAYRPVSYSVIKTTTSTTEGSVEVVDCPIPRDPQRDSWGHGMFWEADECARCLRDGKKESDGLPWSESIAVMEVMDEALRQGGVQYPALITTDVYDAQSPLNTGNQ